MGVGEGWSPVVKGCAAGGEGGDDLRLVMTADEL